MHVTVVPVIPSPPVQLSPSAHAPTRERSDAVVYRPRVWIAFATLTFLEIVLGVDNIIFISILSGKLPPDQQAQARRLGLIGAMLTRVLLLFSLAWIVKLTTPLFTADRPRDLGPRPDPDRRRAVPARQEHVRDSRAARRRGGARGRRARRVVRQRDRADHAARHRVLARLGHHRGRHGRRRGGHGRRR